MANYDLVGDMEKRVRFFDGQFLQDQDFVDEQKYHLDRVRRHNRLLHVAGIAEGLAVEAADANSVTVAPGTAVDADGRQLVLAERATVDLPAETFNNQRGVRIAITYRESAVDRQAREGSEDDTRWLERPEIVRLAANESFKGKTPLVDLAEVALDNQGTVTVDASKREYSGVRLPGTAADAPALRATPAGQVSLTGSLTVNGDVGISGDLTVAAGKRISSPGRLHVSGEELLYLLNKSGVVIGKEWGGTGELTVQGTLKALGNVGIGTTTPKQTLSVNGRLYLENGVIQRGGDAITTTSDLGLYSLVDANWIRIVTRNGPIHFFTDGGVGTTSRLVVNNDGNVGIGTTSPAAKLTVTGGGGGSIDLVVNGRLQSNNNDGGLWVASDRFVGGHSTNQVGFFNNGAWRLTVLNSGNVGIGTISPGTKLAVVGDVGIDGNLSLTAAKTISSAGRLHVSGEELLYLLNKSGVVIGKEWGGTGELTVQGALKALTNVGIGTTRPANDLEIGDYQQQNRYLALKVAGGNAYRCGLKLWAWQDNYGYSIEFDERNTIANGLHVKTHDKAADGTTRVFVGRDGNVGIGNVNTGGHKLHVSGSTWIDGGCFVNGELAYNSNGWKRLEWRWADITASVGSGGPSDLRLKTAVRPIGQALEKVRRLRGVRFRWGDDGLDYFARDAASRVSAGPNATEEQHEQARQAERRRSVEALSGDHVGLIAQDLEPVLPELVHEDEDGYKHIRYQHLTALLVEAIKDQDALVASLAARVADLEAV